MGIFIVHIVLEQLQSPCIDQFLIHQCSCVLLDGGIKIHCAYSCQLSYISLFLKVSKEDFSEVPSHYFWCCKLILPEEGLDVLHIRVMDFPVLHLGF